MDDPLLGVPNKEGQAAQLLTVVLLATKILGYPIKLEKAKAGGTVQWIGAELHIGEDDQGSFVQVSIPKEKVDSLIGDIERFLKAPVIGLKQLSAFAGAASFVAGLVPIMRPFLNPIWASLSKDVTTDDGSKGSNSSARSRTEESWCTHQESGPWASLDTGALERRARSYEEKVQHSEKAGRLGDGD